MTEVSAAARYGWTELVRSDDFEGPEIHPSWTLYDEPGHAGNGVRAPERITARDGILRIAGSADGVTGGMAWLPGQLYGRWEVRARFPPGDDCYHAVLILWPDADDFPVGGEIDYAEVITGHRQELNFFLHYGLDNRQWQSKIPADTTQWHNYAVEWTAGHVIGYVDGECWFYSERPETIPPRPMHQTIQLDWFPQDGRATGENVLEVDWARIYTFPVGDETSDIGAVRRT